MESGSFADWVGVAGTLLALGVSVGLHRASVQERRAVEGAQARSAALAMLSAFREADRNIQWVVGQLRNGERPDQIGIDEGQQSISVGVLLRHRDELKQFLELIPALGKAARQVHDAYASVSALHDDLVAYDYDRWGDDPIYVGPKWQATEQLIQFTAHRLSQATAVLQTVAKG